MTPHASRLPMTNDVSFATRVQFNVVMKGHGPGSQFPIRFLTRLGINKLLLPTSLFDGKGVKNGKGV